MGWKDLTPILFALAPCLVSAKSSRELIGDQHFHRGFKLLSPIPGKVVVVDTISFPGADAEPVWSVAQWHSAFSLEGHPLETLAPGVFRLGNAAKTLIFAPRNDPRGELVLTVNASKEYRGRARKRGEPWPHLLLSQRFADPPSLSDLTMAYFTIEARLLHCSAVETPDATPRLHAAQFQVFFNLQNLNRASPGYGDFLYFGIPLYDNRKRHPGGFMAPDHAGKFIMTPPGETYTRESLHDGRWVRVEKDLLPLLRRALSTAWEKGFLLQSRQEKDYRISAMNLGWEVPGIFDASVQIRDLSLTISRDQPE